jgi:hypothetical protein
MMIQVLMMIQVVAATTVGVGVVLSTACNNPPGSWIRSDLLTAMMKIYVLPSYLCCFIGKEKIMKNLNVFLITGLVLLFTCSTAMGFNYGTSNGSGTKPAPQEYREPDADPVSPVPEPTTMLLLGSGLAALAVGARKKNK